MECAAGHQKPPPHSSAFCGELFTPSYSLLGKSNFRDPNYRISLNDSWGQLFFFPSIGGSYLKEGDFLREVNK